MKRKSRWTSGAHVKFQQEKVDLKGDIILNTIPWWKLETPRWIFVFPWKGFYKFLAKIESGTRSVAGGVCERKHQTEIEIFSVAETLMLSINLLMSIFFMFILVQVCKL